MIRPFRYLSGLSFYLAALPGLFAQEAITPLMGNPRAADYYREHGAVRKSAGATSLTLPVFDDFSSTFVEPDPAIWADQYAFINNSYGVDPVTNGVATLDALDFDGSIYATATIDPTSFVADHLTSHPVMLALPAEDSIYLSFLYQPGGLGDLPEEQDSLLVDFFDPATEAWINVWGIPGTGLHPFRHVMIPVTDGRFLVDGFRFRFRNRASLPRNSDYPDKRANVDHWQIDYVRLDRNRFASDTILRDVAFTSPLNSVLKELTSLPWSHFEHAYNTVLDPSAFVRYRNNDTIPRNRFTTNHTFPGRPRRRTCLHCRTPSWSSAISIPWISSGAILPSSGSGRHSGPMSLIPKQMIRWSMTRCSRITTPMMMVLRRQGMV
jgi:hypothetical protein